MKEAIWFARVIRLIGIKELFNALIYLVGWLLDNRYIVADAQKRMVPGREIFLGLLSLLVGILLLRFASEISLFFIGSKGSRRISTSLIRSSDSFLSLGVRSLAFYAIVSAIPYIGNGFITVVREPSLTTELLRRNSFHYFVWGFLYGSIGFIFSRRPDIVGIFLRSGAAANRDQSNCATSRPLRTALAVMPPAEQPARQPAARRRS
jgi:hypothetical protein